MSVHSLYTSNHYSYFPPPYFNFIFNLTFINWDLISISKVYLYQCFDLCTWGLIFLPEVWPLYPRFDLRTLGLTSVPEVWLHSPRDRRGWCWALTLRRSLYRGWRREDGSLFCPGTCPLTGPVSCPAGPVPPRSCPVPTRCKQGRCQRNKEN